MTRRQPLILALALASAITGCGATPGERAHGDGEASHEAQPDAPKGPHGGRMLHDGDFAVEVTIYERGVPPEFRVWVYDGDRPLDPSAVQLAIDLRRFGGRVDHVRFTPRDGYLLGDGTIEEPHSFAVDVKADHGAATHRWTYDSWEGRTEMSPAAITASGITIETVGPAAIRTTVTANGRIVPNEDRLAHVIPRYPGIVRAVRKRLGDRVASGEVLAIVESNESLQAYEVKGSLDGTVIAKDVTVGEFAGKADAIYTIADLRTVWADLNVPQRDFRSLALGQRVSLETAGGLAKAEGTIVYLSPFGSASTQTLLARIEVANPDSHWRPGLFVSAEILVDETTVPAAVEATALQTFRDWDVIFLNDGDVFQATPVELGRRDAERVEIVTGAQPGQRYAATNSFIVKADVGKSGATHDH
jgi:cobalt-zinc-cadmium efflux system membrane fusion protein